MRYAAAILLASLVMLPSPRPVRAFSPIGNVSGWSVERLQQAGITIRPWRHAVMHEEPPYDWIRVGFDCSRVPKDKDVLMTATILSGVNEVASLRAARSEEPTDKISVLFAVQENYRQNSHLDIIIVPAPGTADDVQGYTLNMNRIVELARAGGVPDL